VRKADNLTTILCCCNEFWELNPLGHCRPVTGLLYLYNETVRNLLIDFKKSCDSVRREVLCNILTEFGIPIILVRLIKMNLNKTYSRVRVANICLTYSLLRMI
jgi:hypothetical protein